MQGPWWLLLPLVGVVVAWKKRRGGPWRMLMLVYVIGVGVTLVSCDPTSPESGSTPIPGPPSSPTSQTSTPEPSGQRPSESQPPASSTSTPPTPTPCPTPSNTPTPELEFTIHFHLLFGSQPVNAQRFVDLTNRFYEGHDVGVTVREGTVRDYTEDETKTILEGDLLLRNFNEEIELDPFASEIVNLLANNLGGGVNAYFVQAFNSGTFGEAYPDRGGFAIARTGSGGRVSDRTFYHELGHMIHGRNHHPESNNYMADGNVATGVDDVTSTQIQEIRDYARNH
jgi:hypothetical protein